MLIAPELFDAIVGPNGAAQTAGGGQRREPRVPLRSRLTIIPCPEGVEGPLGPPLAVPVRDLSRGGMRFLLPRRLPLDTTFVLLLPRPPLALASAARDGADGAPAPLAVESAVIYWQPLAPSLFAIGARFCRSLSGFMAPDVAPRIVLPGQSDGDAVQGPGELVAQRAAS